MNTQRIGLTAGFVALLMIACGGGTQPEATAEEMRRGRGEQLFSTHCTLCHGKDGKLGINGAKDLTVSALTQAEMIALVSTGKGVMMPYKNVLTPTEIEAVVKHVRSLRTVP